MSTASIELENELRFEAPFDRVWDLFSDVPQVIPCIPGGRLLETVDERTWKAEVALDLGFTRVVFHADVSRRELDRAQGRAVLDIHAVDARGKSSATATMISELTPADPATDVQVRSQLTMEGEVARFGTGIIEDVSYEIVEQMTQCLQERLSKPPADSARAQSATTNRLSLWRALQLWVRGRRRRRARGAS